MEVHVTFLCPACGREVKADASEAGKRCFCPHCSAEMLVPFIRLAGDDRQKALDMLSARGSNGQAPRVSTGWLAVSASDRRDSERRGAEGIWARIEGCGQEGAAPCTCRIVNISSRGLAVELPVEDTVRLGKLLKLEIADPFHGRRMNVAAEVVWLSLLSAFDGSTPVGNGEVEDRRYVRMGLAIREVAAADREALDALRRAISM
ncbi:MAG TPA: PilZ domain-containing protein [Planctomycetes bacterium]|nr:PilZ domain-containing protein [Planctomycetota bacterium]